MYPYSIWDFGPAPRVKLIKKTQQGLLAEPFAPLGKSVLDNFPLKNE